MGAVEEHSDKHHAAHDIAERGWPLIQQLLKQHGPRRELVLAAGLCHQPEARDWLLEQLENDDEQISLMALEALSCWGGDVPEDVVASNLEHPAQQRRLAGLQLLLFRAHLLEDDALLRLCEEPLKDFRDPVAIAAIRLLQRRDGEAIAKRLAAICHEGSDPVAHTALRALGCIATPASRTFLQQLSQSLPEGARRDQARRQLKQQFRH